MQLLAQNLGFRTTLGLFKQKFFFFVFFDNFFDGADLRFQAQYQAESYLPGP